MANTVDLAAAVAVEHGWSAADSTFNTSLRINSPVSLQISLDPLSIRVRTTLEGPLTL